MDRLKTFIALTTILVGIPALLISAVTLLVIASLPPAQPPAWDETLQTLPTELEPIAVEPAPVAEPEPEPDLEPVPEPELEIATGACDRDTGALQSRLRRAVGGRARICGIAVATRGSDLSAFSDLALEIGFTVDTHGAVTAIEVAGKIGRDRELIECLEMAFSELRADAHASSCRYQWKLPMRPDRSDSLELVAGGSLTREDIVAGVEANLRGLARCIKRARRRGDLLPGRYVLRLDWTIRPDGSVEDGRLAGPDQLLSGSLPGCVGGAMQRWKFPQSLTALPVKNFQFGPFTVE